MQSLGLPCICTLVLFLVANSNGQLNVGDSCRTSRSEPGTCRTIHNCPSLVKIVRKQPISPVDQRYLQDSVCQWQGQTPIVCCPAESSRPTPAPPPPPPPPTQSVPNDTPNLATHRSISLLPERICGRSYVSKIWGGNETQLGEYPWLALIGYRRSVGGPNTFLCGGVLINSRYILTAAHCTTNISPYTVSTVRLGEHDQSKDKDCEVTEDGDEICAPPTQNFNIDRVITHPAYNTTTKHNDIALLRLSRPADTTQGYVTPICVPYQQSLASKSYLNEELTVSGWGKVNPTTFFSNVKMHVNVPVQRNEQCRSQYSTAGRVILDRQMCAGGVEGKDSCTGDSGGPLMAVDSSPGESLRYFVAGIVSYGPRDCGTRGWPGVYTRVGSYAKWILDNLEE